MNPAELQNFIADFRHWLDHVGAPCLTDDHKLLLESWHQELAAAERLLEKKPELPIAFLGPSQQGKSSLINALLGENILAVGGAVGACTCVITSIHHHLSPEFRAEIDFISLKDWKSELRAMQAAMNAKPSEDDTEDDRKEWESEQKAAHEKFISVYRQEPPEDLTPFLEHATLSLPVKIASAMSSEKPIIIVEENARTLRNNVRHYLVGREQHDDAHFWPLISRVRIYGNFPVLANGIVLVDLPGLNDPNPAREQVTKRYLNDARYLWLICNSQTGIDRVFTQLLRDNSLLHTLYMDGRLDAFSVVTTRIDDINLGAILEQMGIDPDDFDGDHTKPLNFRRKEITSHVQKNLLEIAHDIASRAEHASVREDFFRRVQAVPVFPVSTNAYLHATDRMPLYRGMQLTPEESHIPQLISHLNTITQEQSFRTQIDASYRRLKLLHEQVHSFFLNQIRSVELDSAAARQEWQLLSKVGAQAVADGQNGLHDLQIRSEAALTERCSSFDQKLKELETRAGSALNAVFGSWGGIHWRSLQAAVKRGGEWYSSSTGREFNFSRDVARAYLDQIPFIWEEFFGVHLAALINDVSKGTQAELHKTAERIKGAMDMIQHQPPGIRESLEASLRTAAESFAIQASQVAADLTAQIQRTRQALSNGMVETAASFMQPAYAEAAADPGGTGIKGRMLAALERYARERAPSLFINMRKELAEGVSVLQGSMKPQLAKLIAYGEGMLQRFGQNTGSIEPPTAEVKGRIEAALTSYPKFSL
jgi:Dynamin family